MTVPDEVARLVTGFPGFDAEEQAFPFLTVDLRGFPHVALLSRSELDVSPRGDLVAVISSRNTNHHLKRAGRATLIAVEGTSGHYLKLQVVHVETTGDLVGYRFRVSEYKRDSVGISLTPIGFRTTAELSETEQWARSRALLDELSIIK
ncbi:hypothetical protein [Saccharopolyspora shandongensis]|uniref:hypothetical protein n=1 Tax=Saccharopolyspora shandongensis TaxID=418495 RepID=UPI0033C963A4